MGHHLIQGSKGGGGGGYTPTESPDSLQSIAKAKMLLALGEGEWGRDLDATRIYLNGTPLANPGGEMNFKGIKWEYRAGTQAQEYIKGLPSAENEIRLGVELRSDTPWIRAIANTKLSAVRIRLGWPVLRQQHENADITGYRVDYVIELAVDGGPYKEAVKAAVDGKTMTGYERSHRIDLPKATTGWQIRVRKLTPDSKSESVIDKMNIMAFTEVIDAKLRYPNTALLYIEFDAQQFPNTPQISCKPQGRIIRVPDNYDPVSRTYSGIWSGQFKWAHSDSPAWVFYDIIVSEMFGLGNRINSTQINEAELYRIAQYCDQPVPDGKGGSGTEPRFTCNVYIQSREEAWTVLADLAAIFRGTTYWGANEFVTLADMPADVSYIFNQSNVIGGDFSYSAASVRTRYSVAMVSWSDPDNHYADTLEAISDDELVRRYDINQTELTAIGCTRQSEAQRRGRWALLTNARDSVVSFKVGLEGQIPLPGHIIGVAHKNRAGRVIGGRISAVSERNITLDRKPEAKAGDRLLVNLPSGVSQGRTIQAINGSIVTVTTAYSEIPRAEAGWAIDANDLFIQQYRVTSIRDSGDGTFEISAVYHDPDKYERIDTGARIDERPISVIPPGVQLPPKNVGISSYSVVNQGIAVTTLRITWDAAESAIAYEAEWRRDNGNWISAPRTSTQGFEISNIYAGRYQARVRAINAAEISSLWANAPETHLKGKEGNPPAPLAFRTAPIFFGIQLDWGFAPQTDDTLKTEIQYSKTNDSEGLMLLADIPYPQRTHTMQGLAAGVAFYFRARLVDKSGNQSPWTAFIRGESSSDTNWIIDAAGEEFLSNKAGQRLQSQMDFNSEAIMENAALTGAVVQRQLKVNGDLKAEILHVQSIQVTDREAFAEDMKKVQADVGENAAAVQTKATAVFDIDGNGYAINYVGAGVKYNNQFYKAGMVIGAEVKNGEVKTQIGFSANNFVVMNPDNGKLESVFMIKNGQVFIRDAFIDMADIRQLLVGLDIKSTNYIPNQRGFRMDAKTGHLEINGSGNGYRVQIKDTGWYLFDSNGRAIIELGMFL
ncbi:host specificity protein J [Xenorhabdus bovienii]|uniref:host specificity protein J n=1 Tax=Xenorhabdus bovienii TaxID=40576 RepID=UPI0004D4FDA5|nr:host specificity protein J [Xenorhabdus bovienii]CDG90571.1 putative phage host specificity protein (phage tail protein) [Xenorhabdus bovienii str. feltiae France]CDG91366.1 putative phage host specificity protein (phage tail protein) [Xenorhabdus bovienii str. feltiae Florida]